MTAHTPNPCPHKPYPRRTSAQIRGGGGGQRQHLTATTRAARPRHRGKNYYLNTEQITSTARIQNPPLPHNVTLPTPKQAIIFSSMAKKKCPGGGTDIPAGQLPPPIHRRPNQDQWDGNRHPKPRFTIIPKRRPRHNCKQGHSVPLPPSIHHHQVMQLSEHITGGTPAHSLAFPQKQTLRTQPEAATSKGIAEHHRNGSRYHQSPPSSSPNQSRNRPTPVSIAQTQIPRRNIRSRS